MLADLRNLSDEAVLHRMVTPMGVALGMLSTPFVLDCLYLGTFANVSDVVMGLIGGLLALPIIVVGYLMAKWSWIEARANGKALPLLQQWITEKYGLRLRKATWWERHCSRDPLFPYSQPWRYTVVDSLGMIVGLYPDLKSLDENLIEHADPECPAFQRYAFETLKALRPIYEKEAEWSRIGSYTLPDAEVV